GGVGEDEDAVGLDEERRGDHGDQQWSIENDVALKYEQQNYHCKQADNRNGFDRGVEARDMHLAARTHAAPLHQFRERRRSRRQGNDDVETDREKQGFPQYFDVGYAEQQRNDRREGEDHDDVVERHLYQRVVRVAAGQL